jgi:acyl dehydratase
MERLSPGRLVDEVTVPVEAGKVRELVRATATLDPVHLDREAAMAAGFGGIPAPLTFSVTAGHLRDQQAFVRELGLDIGRIVAGSVAWEYRRPLVVGDVLTATRRVLSDESRIGRSGPMRLVTLVTEFVDPEGAVALVQHEVLVEREAS